LIFFKGSLTYWFQVAGGRHIAGNAAIVVVAGAANISKIVDQDNLEKEDSNNNKNRVQF